MSALESYTGGWPTEAESPVRQLHVVGAGEVSAAQRRRAHAQAARRTALVMKIKTGVGLGSVFSVLALALATIITSFLAVPNLPLL